MCEGNFFVAEETVERILSLAVVAIITIVGAYAVVLTLFTLRARLVDRLTDDAPEDEWEFERNVSINSGVIYIGDFGATVASIGETSIERFLDGVANGNSISVDTGTDRMHSVYVRHDGAEIDGILITPT